MFQTSITRPVSTAVHRIYGHTELKVVKENQICNWKIISDSSSCLFSLSTETTWSKSHSLTSADSGQLGPDLKNNLSLGLFVRESALVLVDSVGAPRAAAADF